MNLRLISVAALALCFGATAQTPHKPPAPPASKAADDSQLYNNANFGFRYRIPYGWVERTREIAKEMQEGNDAAQGEVLLAIFERPPQAPGETVNSAVVMAAENAATYPGLKKAEDYLGRLTEITTSKGFKADGNPSIVDINTRSLVRADFVKPLNDTLTMHQSTLLMLAKGQIVSLTFIADSTDEVNGLIDRLDFSSSKSKAK